MFMRLSYEELVERNKTELLEDEEFNKRLEKKWERKTTENQNSMEK